MPTYLIATVEKKRMLTKLALAELTEFMTPIACAIGVSCAYYGYNSTILGNVQNDYWGYKKVDDIGYLFRMMLLLFGFDAFCVLANSFILSIWTDVSLLRECCRILNRYWHFISVKFALKMVEMVGTNDINLGMDSTGEWNWITNDGRASLINGSTVLSNEEKDRLLNSSIW